MIVVDGRTDIEKLRELLAAPEETHLDFKADLDLSSPRDKLDLVKDVVSMANRPPGGYIIIGAQEGGALSLPTGTIKDRARFDGARLGDLARKYIEGEVHVVSQIHEIDGHEVVLLFVPHHRDGLPVPMSVVGQYQDATGKQQFVFREGDVLVREGAKNTPLRYAHWTDLMSVRDKRIRAETRESVDSILQDLAKAMRGSTGIAAAVPMHVEMSDEAFVEAVISNLEADADIRLRQFLKQAAALAKDETLRLDCLNKITILIAQAMFFERPGVASAGLDALYEIYSATPYGKAKAGLDVIDRLYVLGSLAVRLGQWSTVREIALKRYPRSDNGYVYSSWIRHGQVEASRANLFPKDRGGMMISAARELMASHSEMRPDLPDVGLPDASALDPADALFNSLCQFDILYCMEVEVDGEHHSDGYPASSAMNQDRADPAFSLVAGDSAARGVLFPESKDSAIATAMSTVFQLARRESNSYGGHWWSLPGDAESFVERHASGGQP